MIHITEKAAQQLRVLLEGRASGEGLRLSVDKGGCAGLQYAMEIGGAREGDVTAGVEGAMVYIDAASAGYLRDCTLDYSDDLTGQGFRIRNPNAVRSCGCGTSFEPADGK